MNDATYFNHLKWKRHFGPFVKCPLCRSAKESCALCHGRGKVIREDIDAWNSPFCVERLKQSNKSR